MNQKKSIQKVLIAVLTLAYSSSTMALEFDSIKDLTNYGLKNNPKVLEKKHHWKASTQLSRKLGTLSDPMVGVRLNGNPSKNDSGSFDQKRYVVSQSFPFWGELSHKRRLGNDQQSLAKLEYDTTRNTLVYQISNVVYQIQLMEELLKITQKNIAVLSRIINIANVKYQAGKGTQANVLKAKVARGKIEEQVFFLEHKKQVLYSKLSALLNTRESINLSKNMLKLDTVPKKHLKVLDKWFTHSLAIKNAEANHKIVQSKLRVEKDRFRPDFSLQLEYWDNLAMRDQRSGHIMMSIPWGNPKNYASVSESKEKQSASTQLVTQSKNNEREQLESVVSELGFLQKAVALYEKSLLINGRLSTASYKKAYEVDQASFLDLFESEMALYDLEMKYAKVKTQFWIKKAWLKAQFEQGEIPNE